MAEDRRTSAADGTVIIRPVDRTIPIASVAAGVIIAAASFLTGVFRAPDGSLANAGCLAASAGVSLAVLGLTYRGSLRWAGLYGAVAIIGQAASLQLIKAGSGVGYQHYMPPADIFAVAWYLPLAIIAVQVVITAAGLVATRERIAAWEGEHFTPLRAVIVFAAFVLTSTALSRDPGFYVYDLFITSFLQILGLSTVVLSVMSIPTDSLGRFSTATDSILGHAQTDGVPDHGGLDCFSLVTAGAVTVITLLLAVFVYDAHVHLSDEVSYLYQAKYFAKGLLTMPLPPVPEAFDVDLMFYAADGWYSPVPPGWPMMLAVGVSIGAPWLINPVLSGICVLLAYLLFRGLFDKRTSRLALLLLAVSPWFLFMGMNMLTHTFALASALAAAVCVMRARLSWGLFYLALAGGLAAGVLSAIRPLEGFITALSLGLWVFIARTRKDKKLRPNIITAALFSIGCIATGVLQLIYNKMITGNADHFPIMQYTDRYYGAGSNSLGFGLEKGLGWALDPFPGHGILDAIVNANLNLASINTELFGWASGSVVLIAAILVSGRLRRADILMTLFAAAVIGIHTFYWFSGGPDFGARYWYLVIIPAVALTARAISELSVPAAKPRSSRVLLFACLLTLMAAVNFMPWRSVDKYTDYLGMRADIRTLAKANDLDGALVLVSGTRFPDYASAAVLNPVDLTAQGRTIYAWDKNPEVRARVIRAYPGRPVWSVNGPSITGRGYEITSRPGDGA